MPDSQRRSRGSSSLFCTFFFFPLQNWTIFLLLNYLVYFDKDGFSLPKKFKRFNLSLSLDFDNPTNSNRNANLTPLTGNYWKRLDSIILSHVLDEPSTLVPPNLSTEEDFTNFITSFLPPYAQAAGLVSRIIARYPPVRNGGPYATERKRLEALFGDVVFLCNVRALTDAYTGKNFNLQYSTTPSTHGSDVFPLFIFPGFDLDAIKPFTAVIPGFEAFAQTYRSYFVSHARSGNPNTYRKSYGGFEAIHWPRPDNRGDALKNVLNATDSGFEVTTDELTKKSTCRFWQDFARDVTELGGLLIIPPPFFFLNDDCC